VAYATNLLAPASAFRWIRGEDGVTSYRVADAKFFTNPFCATCRSIMPHIEGSSGLAIVPAGSLDGDPGARPGLHIYVGSKAPWFEIADELPRFDESPPRSAPA